MTAKNAKPPRLQPILDEFAKAAMQSILGSKEMIETCRQIALRKGQTFEDSVACLAWCVADAIVSKRGG